MGDERGYVTNEAGEERKERKRDEERL